MLSFVFLNANWHELIETNNFRIQHSLYTYLMLTMNEKQRIFFKSVCGALCADDPTLTRNVLLFKTERFLLLLLSIPENDMIDDDLNDTWLLQINMSVPSENPVDVYL